MRTSCAGTVDVENLFGASTHCLQKVQQGALVEVAVAVVVVVVV